MQNSSAFQYLAIDTIHESTTNPRRTFETMAQSQCQRLSRPDASQTRQRYPSRSNTASRRPPKYSSSCRLRV